LFLKSDFDYKNDPIYKESIFQNQTFQNYTQELKEAIENAPDPIYTSVSKVYPEVCFLIRDLKENFSTLSTEYKRELDAFASEVKNVVYEQLQEVNRKLDTMLKDNRDLKRLLLQQGNAMKRARITVSFDDGVPTGIFFQCCSFSNCF
jgi:hypothetical protein